jgi:oxygen-independent coproporphyrinogen-3 oxidase
MIPEDGGLGWAGGSEDARRVRRDGGSVPRGGTVGEGPIETRHVYVHAPFCARRCFYCDFAVQVRRGADPGPWAEAIGKEVALLREEGRAVLAPTLDTLYIGGGTPSLLGEDAMARLAEALGPRHLTDPALEWTAEANPESVTPELARAWRRSGVNRMSLGVQSFQDTVLRWMGRLHGAEGARRAVAVLRAAGITDLSVDLIFGLPEGLPRDWRADLQTAIALDVPHVSLYGLTAETGTPLGRGVEEGRISMAGETRYEEEYLEASERLAAAGYRHYEVSNFARGGAESRHNRAYWDGRPYLGIGNSSHSYLPPLRRWNLRDWSAYLSEVECGRLPVGGEDRLSVAARRLEWIWLGLRTDRGLPLERLPGAAAEARIRGWVRRGLAWVDEVRIGLTARGWLVLDSLAVELDETLGDPRPG